MITLNNIKLYKEKNTVFFSDEFVYNIAFNISISKIFIEFCQYIKTTKKLYWFMDYYKLGRIEKWL